MFWSTKQVHPFGARLFQRLESLWGEWYLTLFVFGLGPARHTQPLVVRPTLHCFWLAALRPSGWALPFTMIWLTKHVHPFGASATLHCFRCSKALDLACQISSTLGVETYLTLFLVSRSQPFAVSALEISLNKCWPFLHGLPSLPLGRSSNRSSRCRQ